MTTYEPTDQHVDMLWETPTHSEIVDLTKGHVQAMETMNDDMVWVQAGMHHVLLHTLGRKSGTEHKVALPTWNDPSGNRIIVASFAGATKHPSWFINLRDRDANPRVKCRVQNGLFWSEADILEGDEHAEMWGRLTADRSWYNTYQSKTDRQIPLVRLPETEQIAE